MKMQVGIDIILKEIKNTLKKGESIVLRHRVIFHKGDHETAKIAEAYKAYAREK